MKELSLSVKGVSPSGELLLCAEDVKREIQLIIDGNEAECASYKRSLADRTAELEQVKRVANELAAQSERLQKLLHVLISDIEWHHTKTAFIPIALAVKAANFKDVVKETPAQYLAENNREVASRAVESAIRSALRTFGNADLSEDEVKKLASEYSGKVLRGEI